jgi:NAD(P)-dependent dehydrogenase (short-subunit alcohol dehydrogenase family)
MEMENTMSMTIDLSGKTALVTGASRGIGRAIALALGAAGARVAVHGFSNAASAGEIAKRAGNGSEPFVADLSDEDAPDVLFDRVVGHFGKLDILVNNAGVALEMPIGQSRKDWGQKWQKTMSVNARASEWLARRAVQHFREHGGGRMVHIASRAAFRGDTQDYITYAASKGAVVAMSRSVARAFGKDNVCSFVIAPGWVRTDMASDHLDQAGEAAVVEELALPRLTEPEDIAPMVVLLASGLADHATGTSIDINAASYVR